MFTFFLYFFLKVFNCLLSDCTGLLLILLHVMTRLWLLNIYRNSQPGENIGSCYENLIHNGLKSYFFKNLFPSWLVLPIYIWVRIYLMGKGGTSGSTLSTSSCSPDLPKLSLRFKVVSMETIHLRYYLKKSVRFLVPAKLVSFNPLNLVT